MSEDIVERLRAPVPLSDCQAQRQEAASEIAALRRLCAGAASLYGGGGTFPINGEMAQRLKMAALGVSLAGTVVEGKE